MRDDEDYIRTVEKLAEICPTAIPDYVRMIFLDTVTANPDRHTNNFGLLRDTVSGKLTALAPNFDNNMALISRGYPSKAKPNDFLICLFNELTGAYPEYKKYIPEIDESVVLGVIKEINMKVRSKQVAEIIMSRYALINK